MPPGMIFKFENKAIDSMRLIVDDFLPTWITLFKIPENYNYTMFKKLPDFL